MLNETSLKERLDFLRLDTETLRDLRAIAPVAENILPDVLKQFYTHVGKHPDVAKFFTGQDRIEHAASRQFAHWKRILTGEFGTEYLTSVEKIGNVHARIGLEPQYYLGGYTFLIEETLSEAQALYSDKKGMSKKNLEKFTRFRHAFLRAALLDMDLSIHFFNEARARERHERLLEMVDTFEKGVGSISNVVASAAEEISSTAQSMTNLANTTQSEFAGVSASITQATNGVRTAAESSDDLGRAVSEISSQMSMASQLVNRSVQSAERAGVTIRTLSETADRVGQVISMISDIAEQTNLLALNATIESARAGEAGKGFAVVATEVKSLAGQTARATEDIGSHIKAMLDVTNASVEAIEDIRNAINEINGVSMSINSAIEEQAASTRAIAQNTSEAARGNQDVADTLVRVTGSAENTKLASEEVLSAANELGSQAQELQSQVDKFIGYIRAS